jgi:hypothetical protein
VSLIREQTAAMRPPRALWVPFMLGRPFGSPNEPAFQRRVVLALLGLFERTQGPVLENFPEDAPVSGESDAEAAFACPVSFAASDEGNDLTSAVQREIAQLAPWYELAKKRRGRTSFGISGRGIEDAARYAMSWLAGDAASNRGLGTNLKHACDDIKTYYYEAVAAQPGNLSARAIDRWFWNETAAAKLLFELRQMCLDSADPSLKPLGTTTLVPRRIVHERAS